MAWLDLRAEATSEILGSGSDFRSPPCSKARSSTRRLSPCGIEPVQHLYAIKNSVAQGLDCHFSIVSWSFEFAESLASLVARSRSVAAAAVYRTTSFSSKM